MITIGTGIVLYAMFAAPKGQLEGEVKPGLWWLIAVASDIVIGVFG